MSYNYKKLSPFKLQCLTNFPFIDEDFDALTNYELLCKIVEYLNDVSSNNNMLVDNITELNDWFNSLDVQNEINNKLDKMAQDGSLYALISRFVNPLIENQNNRINNLENRYDAKLLTIENKVDSTTSGSPSGVYDTVNDLESDDPDHSKIYVVTENGHWYYYNNTTNTWTDGGVYQASVNSTDVNELLKIAKLTPVTLNGIVYDISGYYSTTNYNAGAYTNSMSYWITGAIKVNINVTTAQYYNIYTFLDQNEDVISYEREVGSSKQYNKTIEVPENAVKLVISGTTASTATAIVTAYYSLNNKVENTLSPFRILPGFWRQSDNNYRHDTGYKFYVYNVENYESVNVESKAFQYSNVVELLDKDYNIIKNNYYSMNTHHYYQLPNSNYSFRYNTKGCKYICISTTANSVAPIVKGFIDKELLKIENEEKINNPLKDKNIVWLGTSIPAGGKYGLNNQNSYPNIIGSILKCNMYNESVGTSSVHCKDVSRISTSNPYGFNNNFENSSRCLSNTIEEMNYIIDHFDDTNIFTYATVSSLSDDDKEFIRSCSYENKLSKYFNDLKRPDIWIIDHGHNDNPSESSESTFYERDTLVGIDKLGFYNNGTFVSGTHQSFEYDVTDIDEVFITGTFQAYYDYYDLFDANGNNIAHKRCESTGSKLNEFRLYTGNATKLVVSNNPTYFSTMSVKKMKYGTTEYNSLYSFTGGMNFIINKIKEYDKNAKIFLIGEYENELKPLISEYQELIADSWDFPIYKAWKNYGFSQEVLLTRGGWNNGVWNDSGFTQRYVTYHDIWLADGIHPHSDLTGKCNNYIADKLTQWLITK